MAPSFNEKNLRTTKAPGAEFFTLSVHGAFCVETKKKEQKKASKGSCNIADKHKSVPLRESVRKGRAGV